MRNCTSRHADLVRLAAHPRCVAIGEAGLDYHYEGDYAAQATGFRRHIAAARETGLPLVIHAAQPTTTSHAILEEETGQGAFPFVLHCFSAGIELARRGLALGGYISFSGIITFKNAEEIREVAAFAPADRILVETDAPYLAPVPHRGHSNEPSFVRHTAEKLAEVRGVSLEEIGSETTAEFRPAVLQRRGCRWRVKPSDHRDHHWAAARPAACRASAATGASAIRPTRRTAAAAARC